MLGFMDRSGSLDQRAELIRDTASEVDMHEMQQEKLKQEMTKKRWKRPDETYVRIKQRLHQYSRRTYVALKRTKRPSMNRLLWFHWYQIPCF